MSDKEIKDFCNNLTYDKLELIGDLIQVWELKRKDIH